MMAKIQKLNQDNLYQVPKAIKTPKFNREKLKSNIVHVGVSKFHRSHEAFYINQFLNSTQSTDWGICGVSIQPSGYQRGLILKEQDYLYTLMTQHANGKIDCEVIGSLTNYLNGYENPQVVVNKMAHQDTKIVSLTIRQGYNFNHISGEFNFNNPEVQHEINNPKEPRTIFGYLYLALHKRYHNGLPPFSILSCDNIHHNGDMIKRLLLAYTKKINTEIAEWLENNIACPNSVVDRITPTTNHELIDYLQSTYSLEDNSPIVCEPYLQWIIEDNFSDGRPELEEVGVKFVSDVTPYENMKIRLLNASHSILGTFGMLHGYELIKDCMEDEIFIKFICAFMDKEATPVLDENLDIDKYKSNLIQRFSNPYIKDTVVRIFSESSTKFPRFLIPTIKENITKGGDAELSILVLATWCYCNDKLLDEDGNIIEIIDLKQEQLHNYAIKTSQNTLSFIQQSDIFGDLVSYEKFTYLYIKNIKAVYESQSKGQGIRHLMKSVLCEN